MPDNEADDGIVEDLKEEILTSGLSYKQIEEEAGISSGSISRFMRDGRDIGFSTAAKIAKFFQLRLNRAPAHMEGDPQAGKILYLLSEMAKTSDVLKEESDRLREEQEVLRDVIHLAQSSYFALPDERTMISARGIQVPRKRGRPPKDRE